MSFTLLGQEVVNVIHGSGLNPGELPGRPRDKSMASALARVENRMVYGLIEDAFDLAAMYAVAIAMGHCFNDAKKRSAFRAMSAALMLNGERITWTVEEVGPVIVEVAQGRMEADALATWLREKAEG